MCFRYSGLSSRVAAIAWGLNTFPRSYQRLVGCENMLAQYLLKAGCKHGTHLQSGGASECGADAIRCGHECTKPGIFFDAGL